MLRSNSSLASTNTVTMSTLRKNQSGDQLSNATKTDRLLAHRSSYVWLGTKSKVIFFLYKGNHEWNIFKIKDNWNWWSNFSQKLFDLKHIVWVSFDLELNYKWICYKNKSTQSLILEDLKIIQYGLQKVLKIVTLCNGSFIWFGNEK